MADTLRALWKPFLVYACLLSLLTVGAVYLATDSGFFMLFAVAGGLLLVVLGVGATGPAGVGGVESGEGAEMGLEDVGAWPGTGNHTSSDLILLLYGSGVFLWGLVALFTLYDIAV